MTTSSVHALEKLTESLLHPAPPRPASRRASPERGERRLVLVVARSNILRLVLQMVLEREGFSCLTAGNGVEALGMLKLGLRVTRIYIEPDLPHLSGLEVTRQIRRLEAGLPPVEIVGIACNSEAARACREAGMTDVLLEFGEARNLREAMARETEIAALTEEAMAEVRAGFNRE